MQTRHERHSPEYRLLRIDDKGADVMAVFIDANKFASEEAVVNYQKAYLASRRDGSSPTSAFREQVERGGQYRLTAEEIEEKLRQLDDGE